MIKGMLTIGMSFYLLDSAVSAFSNAVGFSVFHAVLNIAAVVLNGIGGRGDLRDSGRGIGLNPVRQVGALQLVQVKIQDMMEFLKSIISSSKVWRKGKDVLDTLFSFWFLFLPVV